MMKNRNYLVRYIYFCLILSLHVGSQSYAQEGLPESRFQLPSIDVTEEQESETSNSIPSSSSIQTGSVEDLRIDLREENASRSSNPVSLFDSLDGVQVNHTTGQETFMLRGISSHQIAVQQDGFSLNNPVGIQRESEFFLLDTSEIESVEIYPGSQTAWFGRNAFGGVVQLQRKKIVDRTQANASLIGGSLGYFAQKGSIAQKESGVQLSVSHEAQKGISAASESFGNQERDGFEKLNIHSRVSNRMGKKLFYLLDFQYNDLQNDLDQGGGLGRDDPNYQSNVKQWMAGGEVEQDMGSFVNRYALYYQFQKRTLDDEPDDLRPGTLLKSNYRSRQLSGEVSSKATLGESFLETGYRFEQDRAEIDIQSQMSGFPEFRSNFSQRSGIHQFYLRNKIQYNPNLSQKTAIRYLEEDRSDGNWAAQSQIEYGLIPKRLIFSGSISRGVRFASLYQRFSTFGDPDLKTEESLYYSLGTRWNFSDQSHFKAVFFKTDFNNLIDYSFSSNRYLNVSGQVFGSEFSVNSWLTSNLNTKLSYTLQWAKNEDENQALLRRARHMLQLSSDLYLASRRIRFTLLGRYMGSRDDILPTSDRVTLDPYFKFDFASEFKLSKNIYVLARLENLFNANYQSVFGYGTPGRTGYIGFKSILD